MEFYIKIIFLSSSFPLYLEFAGHLQLLGGHSNGIVKQNHDGDGEKHCKVTDHGPHLCMGENGAQRSVVTKCGMSGFPMSVNPQLSEQSYWSITLVGK